MIRDAQTVVGGRVALGRRDFFVCIGRVAVLFLIEFLVPDGCLTKRSCSKEKKKDDQTWAHIGSDFTALLHVTLALCRVVRQPVQTRISWPLRAFRPRVWQ